MRTSYYLVLLYNFSIYLFIIYMLTMYFFLSIKNNNYL